jgi:hypothetical protein
MHRRIRIYTRYTFPYPIYIFLLHFLQYRTYSTLYPVYVRSSHLFFLLTFADWTRLYANSGKMRGGGGVETHTEMNRYIGETPN